MNIDKKKIIDLYERMLKIRLTEETIAERYSEEKMRCPTHLSIGQEAIASGVCGNLNNNDFALLQVKEAQCILLINLLVLWAALL